MDAKNKRILFLGNSVNRVAGRNEPYSWGKLLDDMESAWVPDSERIDGLSYPLRIERIQNYALLENKPFLEKWREELQALKPTFAHRLMAQVAHDFFARVLTTNYDEAMELALAELPCMNGSLAHKLVTHIHGKASNAESKLVMSQQSYIDLASKIAEQSWLDDFCNSEVHICGFAMDAGELVIWSALRERQKRLRDEAANFSRLGNHVFIYLFYTESNETEQRALASLLRSYGTRPLLIPVPQGDYRAAWLQLFGRMYMILTNRRYTEENSLHVCTERYAQAESKKMPLVTSYAPSAKHPNCAWVSISHYKRATFKSLYFYIDLDGEVSMWQCPTEFVNKGFARFHPQHSDKDYHFYLDVCRGALMYAEKGTPTMELKKAVSLYRIADFAQFDSLLKSYKKNTTTN